MARKYRQYGMAPAYIPVFLYQESSPKNGIIRPANFYSQRAYYEDTGILFRIGYYLRWRTQMYYNVSLQHTATFYVCVYRL